MTEEKLLPDSETEPKMRYNSKVQYFFVHLLVLLALPSQPYFYLVEVFILGLILSLAIGRVEFTGGEITIGFSKYFL